jgi:sigma-B regulation protein RsbU (phosphoserine phosphatase)
MFDMVGSLVGVGLGYVLFIVFFVRTGARLADIQAELRLARAFHQTLVPSIACTLGRFEFCGGAHSAGQVGGDLLDVIPVADDRWVAYVADVAGHGVPSALLTGIVKSAHARAAYGPWFAVGRRRDLNRIVCDNSAPNVFVTLAAIEGGKDHTIDYIVAGHPPILRISSGMRTIEEVGPSQLALGIDREWCFEARSIHCRGGDLLTLVTDGLLEVFNRQGDEFGLPGLTRELADCGADRLPDIRDRLQAAAWQHGPQIDDQTTLLVRCCGQEVAATVEVAGLQ